MRSDNLLLERVVRQFASRKVAAEPMRMMGGTVFMKDAKLCVGVKHDRIRVRTGSDARAEAIKRPGCTPMEMAKRTTKRFVWVEAEYLRTQRQPGYWIGLALTYNPEATASKRKARKRKRPD